MGESWLVGENSPKYSRLEPLNQSSRAAIQTIRGSFSLSQRERAGVRENCLNARTLCRFMEHFQSQH